MQWGVPKILAAARGGAIYDHPGNVDSKVGVDIGWPIPIRLRTTLGEGQINLGHVKGGKIYDRPVQVKYELTPKDGQSSFL